MAAALRVGTGGLVSRDESRLSHSSRETGPCGRGSLTIAPRHRMWADGFDRLLARDTRPLLRHGAAHFGATPRSRARRLNPVALGPRPAGRASAQPFRSTLRPTIPVRHAAAGVSAGSEPLQQRLEGPLARPTTMPGPSGRRQSQGHARPPANCMNTERSPRSGLARPVTRASSAILDRHASARGCSRWP